MIDKCLKILDQDMMFFQSVTDFSSPKEPGFRSYISEAELKARVRNDVQFFDVSNIDEFSHYLSCELFSENADKNFIPEDTKFPSKNFCFFSSAFKEYGIEKCIYCLHIVDNSYEVFCPDNSNFINCLGIIDFDNQKIDGSYVSNCAPEPEVSAKLHNKVLIEQSKWLMSISIILTNQEIITESAAGMRQQRKAAAKRHKIKPDRWSKICWNVQEPARQSDKNSDQIIRQPLHFTRGHWRKALESHPKSVQRPSAINEQNRLLWWTWIDGYWSGHPAYGFKKSVYQPEIKNPFAK